MEDTGWRRNKKTGGLFNIDEIKNKGPTTINEYMNNFIRINTKKKEKTGTKKYVNVDELAFQTDKYGENIEKRDKEKIEIFKKIIQTKQDYRGFKYKDISFPIILERKKKNGKLIMYDGQHRYIAYKQLGYKKIPFKWKDELSDEEWKHLKKFA